MIRTFKRIMAAMLVATMAVAVLPATGTVANATQKETAVTSEEVTQSSSKVADASNQIVVYSWNGELEDKVDIFLKDYPQYRSRIKNVIFDTVGGTSAEYWDAIKNNAFKNSTTSIVAFDCDVVDEHISEFDPLSKVGISASDYANAYDFTKKTGTSNGQLKAVTWHAYPGCFVYNAAIAQKVLGTSDPTKVQSLIATPERFLAVAEQMKNAGFYMAYGFDKFTYGEHGFNYGISANQEEVGKYLYNQMLSKGYAPNYWSWSEEWNAGFTNNKVFGYVGAPWFAQWSMPDGAHGRFRVCQGPVSYAWGGTYLTVKNTGKNKSNDQLAGLLLKYLTCDSNSMAKIAIEGRDFPNNKKAVSYLISKNINTTDTLYNQNPLSVYNAMATNVLNEPYLYPVRGKVSLIHPTTKAIVKRTGFYIYKGNLYYVTNGVVNMATGLVKVQGKYYYVQRGKLITAPGLVKYGGAYWYVNGGSLSNVTTLVKYNGAYWYVVNGKLNNATTLVKYNGKYYYVLRGKFTASTTLVKYNGKYYYVKKGILDTSYTGTFVYNGVRWKIVKGVVTGRA